MLNENNNNNKDTKYLKQKKERNLIKFKRFLILLVFTLIKTPFHENMSGQKIFLIYKIIYYYGI